MENEEWKAIPGKDYFEISSKGRIRNIYTGELEQQYLNQKGYCLWRGLSVHRLVWSAFNGPIPKGMEVNHINQKRDDNHLENLNLLTHKQNINWGTGPALRAAAHYKKVLQYDKEGNLVREWESVKSIQEETGWKKGFIANCCRQLPHFNTAYGFVWRYAE